MYDMGTVTQESRKMKEKKVLEEGGEKEGRMKERENWFMIKKKWNVKIMKNFL